MGDHNKHVGKVEEFTIEVGSMERGVEIGPDRVIGHSYKLDVSVRLKGREDAVVFHAKLPEGLVDKMDKFETRRLIAARFAYQAVEELLEEIDHAE